MKNNYKEVLNRYTYQGDKKIIERISNCQFKNEIEINDIINSIILWKINRQVETEKNVLIRLKNLNLQNCKDLDLLKSELGSIIEELLNTKGIRIAIASTILKMFYPNILPIIDQRAYREIYQKEFPNFYGKKANFKYFETYFDYVKKCHIYKNKNCPDINFCELDKLLYQLDREKKNTINY